MNYDSSENSVLPSYRLKGDSSQNLNSYDYESERMMNDIFPLRDKLKNHFKEEVQCKVAIRKAEKEIEHFGWSLLNKKAECNLVIKEKGHTNI